ncbi:MAG: hypothetical protein JWP87_2445 [Labilithrix sp.]|nr:hypothetical protein [Labilithrix sp.]
MHLRRRLITITFVASALVAGTTSLAWADPSLSDRETARSLMDDGDAKRDKGDFKAALKSYEAADAIMHVPTTGLEVARAQAQLGLLLEARETLGRVVRLPPKPGEPAPFSAARKTAEALSAELGARIPSITVLATNGEPGQTTVIVFDGEIVPPAASQAPRKVNPGRHSIVARSGAMEKKQDVEVAERESKTVTFDLKPAPAPVAHVDEPAASSSGPSSLPKVLIYGGFGLGVVGIGVGAVTGLMSISKVNDVKQNCPNDVCPLDRQSDIDSAKSLGTISTIAFIAGGVGVGAGIIGLVLQGKQSSEAPPPGTTAKNFRIAPSVGPTWAGVHGTF